MGEKVLTVKSDESFHDSSSVSSSDIEILTI